MRYRKIIISLYRMLVLERTQIHSHVRIINQFYILCTVNETNVEGQLKILIQIFQGLCSVGNE